MNNSRKIGTIGEKIAQNYLDNKGYEIVKTNFYTKRGEIDIIAKKENCMIFIEVKTRTSLKFGPPSMSVNSSKKKHIKIAATTYIYLNKLYQYEIRFDVIEVLINNGKCQINHIEGVM